MTLGTPFKSGDIILAQVQFTDTYVIKKRPAVVLFEEYDSVVITSITSNKNMSGIPISTEEGAIKDSVIKLNYIFTIAKFLVQKVLFSHSDEKKLEIYYELTNKLKNLIS